MNKFEVIIYEKQDDIGYITLNRPQFLNVYNIQMRDELYQVLSAIEDDAEVKVAIFKGAG
ncbi:enoyl-CoA hydratase/isomerase family protein, partial [Chloroflexota bacterium]